MILAFLLTKVGRIVASAFVLVFAFTTWLVTHDAKVSKRGAEKAVAKIEAANDKAVQAVNRARSKSGVAGVRGNRDPHTVDD